MSTSLYVIQGVITPPSLGSTSGVETVSRSACLTSKVIQKASGNESKALDERDPLFWKKRIIQTFIKAPYLLSMSFLPAQRERFTILFVQKSLGEAVGFYAPYLNADEKAKWKESSLPLQQRVITDLQSIEGSLEGVDATIYTCINECLRYFFSDTTTSGLVITFKGPQGTPESRYWAKRVSSN